MRILAALSIIAAIVTATACASQGHAAEAGRVKAKPVMAGWYGPKHLGRKTASGEHFDPDALTAAHASLPLGSVIEVRRWKDKRVVRVRINDRCGRCSLDLSPAAARRLGMINDGRALVTLHPVSARIRQD